MREKFKNVEFIDIINMICFIGVFIIMSNLLMEESYLLYRIFYSVLLVWGLSNIALIIKKIYSNKRIKN